MIVRFNNYYLETLYQGEQKGKPRFNEDVVIKFKKTINILKNAESSNELRLFRSLNFEQLKGGKGSKYYSVRVDIQYHLIFELIVDQILLSEIVSIEELSNHYK
jgi:toxin HigB-1